MGGVRYGFSPYRYWVSVAALTTIRYLAKCLIMSMVFKALSDPTRRRVLELLRQKPMSAGEIAEHFEVSKPTMSAHFTVLREADLVASEKHGKAVIYQLKMSVLEEALMGFAQVFGWDLMAQDEETSVPAKKAPSQ